MTALAPTAPPTADIAFRLGIQQCRAGQWNAGAAALLFAARSGDHRAIVLRGMGECARNLVAQGRGAPSRTLPDKRAGGRISIIVCSITPEKLGRLKQNLDERLIGEDWELIHIADATSLCDGYTRGLKRSTGDLVVMCHDDIRIVSLDFADKLRAYLGEFDLIGVAGTTRATGPGWGWGGPPYLYAWVSQSCLMSQFKQDGAVTLLMGTRGPVVRGAQLLDGVFLAARRSLVDRIGFDAATFDDFHFYDLDFSYRAYLSGAKTAICMDILLYHDSAGDFGATYRDHAQRFCEKFPEACSLAETPVQQTVPWIPIAGSDDAIRKEMAWLSHWIALPDADLAARLYAGSRAAADGA